MKNNISLYYLVIILMIAIPKSGISIGSIPLNFIVLLILVTLPILPILYFLKRKISLDYSDLYLFFLIPFMFIFFIITLGNGISSNSTYLGHLFSFIITPFFFYFLFKLTNINTIKNNFKILVFIIRFVAIYGLILFLYKLLSGDFFEIPGITTTYGSSLKLEDRMNDRGGTYKLFSTYNNGNLYGISLCMLLPLYLYLEKNKLFIFLTIISLILTLSRTVWALLFIYFFFNTFINFTFNLKKISFSILLLLIFSSGTLYLIQNIGLDMTFVFDSQLGGRMEYVRTSDFFNFYSIEKFQNFYEIPYITILNYVGWIGIPFFLMYFSNIIINLRYLFEINNSLNKAIYMGILLYFFATFSDAAIMFVPVFLIFMYLNFLLLKLKNERGE